MLNTTWAKNLKTPIAIIGLGKSGLSALRFLKALGYKDSDLITFDEKNETAQISNSKALLLVKPQTLVVSPGVSLKTDWIKTLAAAGATITSEISLATFILTNEILIGITGSVGKSTVTSLLGEGAKKLDPNCFIGGNLGTPFCDYANEVLNGRPRAKWIVLELSSYQLENCEKLSLQYSAITFLSPNHLERYENLEEYYFTKLKITDITKDICVFNKTSEDAVKYSRESKCAITVVNSKNFTSTELLEKVFLIGSHNKDNFTIAAEIARLAGWSESALLAMADYRGLSHRLEYAGTVNGVKYINDSKATAMDSVAVATQGCLESLSKTAKLYLLLGGKDKNLPWEQLSILSSYGRIHCVFFGACGKLAQEKSELHGPYFEKLGAALEECYLQAKDGDVVLLSPGGTSLDEFKNFEDRGEFFKRFVTQQSAKH